MPELCVGGGSCVGAGVEWGAGVVWGGSCVGRELCGGERASMCAGNVPPRSGGLGEERCQRMVCVDSLFRLANSPKLSEPFMDQ